MPDAARRPFQPEDLLAITSVTDPQLSPDGARVAYVQTVIDAEQDEYRSTIWMASSEGGEPVQFTRGAKRDTAPRWSPDGRLLAFLSDRDDERPQLYVMPASGGEARKLTSLDGGASPAVWSPDGTCIVMAPQMPVETPPKDKQERDRWKQRPREIGVWPYKADGMGFILQNRSHLLAVSLADGEPAPLTEGDANDRAPAWSPDGRTIAFTRTRNADEPEPELSDVWLVDPNGANPRRHTFTAGGANAPSWSPDGRTIAFFAPDEPGEPHPRVWIVPASGGDARALTSDYDRAAVLAPPPAPTPGPVWSPDGTTLTFSVADRGNVHLVRVAVRDGAISPVLTGERWVSSPHAAPSAGRIAYVVNQPDNPGDLHVCNWDGSGERRLTAVNAALFAHVELPPMQRRTFEGPNGPVEGWVVRSTETAGASPLMVTIHGGPHSFIGNTFPALHWYILASRGWTVLALNPSGSTSYGRDFALSLRGRWGEYDLPEQLAAVDTLIAEGTADPDRLAVSGFSYGGYMTAWTTSHTGRFKAAVVGAPLINLTSAYGTSDITARNFPKSFGTTPQQDPELYRRLSPITYVDQVSTPTLILHGEADDRCPAGQGEEWYIGLLTAGKAPVSYVRYPGGSHGFAVSGRPSHRVDFHRRIVEWAERWTLAHPATTAPPEMEPVETVGVR
jgi:dipeptidyl aminopeptidase/acylaminoacyl peptidase